MLKGDSMTPRDVLEPIYGKDIADHLFDAYSEIESNYVYRKWKPSELDGGHFVETVRRILEFEFSSGKYTPFNEKLGQFNDQALKKYENQTGDDSYRMHIPRILKSIYNVRNKRGVAHISSVSPNEMDATLILYSVKWVLAELVRLKSGKSPHDTQEMMNQIVERHIPLLWKDNGIEIFLNPNIRRDDLVLLYLYVESPRTMAKLGELMRGFVNLSNLLSIINILHDNALLHKHPDTTIQISPTGYIKAEELLRKYALAK